jgi:DNA-binding response OmpR family regulator
MAAEGSMAPPAASWPFVAEADAVNTPLDLTIRAPLQLPRNTMSEHDDMAPKYEDPETLPAEPGPSDFAPTWPLALKLEPHPRILVVDDDVDIVDTLTDQLSINGKFSVGSAATAQAALALVKSEPFDLVIMEVGLPDMDGREAVRVLRARGARMPIIILTGHASDADTVAGLDSGANDYVAKPFSFAVLLARIRVHLRQHESSDDAVLRIGPLQFKPASKLIVTDKGSKLKLTEKEASILRFLYLSNGHSVARNVLLHEVWGCNPAVSTHTLETHIYRLRQKIESGPDAAKMIVTDKGGYKLVT